MFHFIVSMSEDGKDFSSFVFHPNYCYDSMKAIFPVHIPILPSHFYTSTRAETEAIFFFSYILSVFFYYFCLKANTTFHFPTHFEMSLNSFASTPLSNNKSTCGLKFELSMENVIKSKYQEVK